MKNPFKTMDDNNNASSDNEDPDPNEILLRCPGEYSTDPRTRALELARVRFEDIEEENLRKLDKLLERTGMPLTQENGQRRYGPPLDCEITIPPRGTVISGGHYRKHFGRDYLDWNFGSEVFVGRIPRDCFEWELVPVFEMAGRIYELRLMMDFSGTNRGYCFVHYFTPEEADKAIRDLNNYEIRKGYRIGVVKSVDNRRLFFGDIPRNKTKEDVRKEIDKQVDGVVGVEVVPSKYQNEKNRGYAFIEFKSHKAAAMARRKFMSGKVPMWGTDVAVDWAEPPEEERYAVVSKSTRRNEKTSRSSDKSNASRLKPKDRNPAPCSQFVCNQAPYSEFVCHQAHYSEFVCHQAPCSQFVCHQDSRFQAHQFQDGRRQAESIQTELDQASTIQAPGLPIYQLNATMLPVFKWDLYDY